MNKNIIGICIIVAGCFSACANREADYDSSLTNTDSLQPATIAPVPQDLAKSANPFPGPGQAPGVLFPKSGATPASSSTNAAGINPPHGQPNHRCEIAVGAPLNLPATKPATQTISATPATIPAVLPAPAQSTTAKTVTPPGMNPPHGEPGHRCDIAAGAPLNSPATKPATPTITPTPLTNPAVKTTAAPAQKTTAKTITPAGMNPPHGETGHRCDIAVGAPLNSPVIKSPAQTVTPTSAPALVIPSPKKDSGI